MPAAKMSGRWVRGGAIEEGSVETRAMTMPPNQRREVNTLNADRCRPEWPTE
jgi:hypothetical protein